MSVKVYGWLVDGGDGSTSILWVKESDQEAMLAYVEGDEYDYFHDGDGETCRAELVFDSYEAAEAAGLDFYEVPSEEE